MKDDGIVGSSTLPSALWPKELVLLSPQVYNTYGSEGIAPSERTAAPAHSSDVCDVESWTAPVKSLPRPSWIAVHEVTTPDPVVINSARVLSPTPYTLVSVASNNRPVSLSLWVKEEISFTGAGGEVIKVAKSKSWTPLPLPITTLSPQV